MHNIRLLDSFRGLAAIAVLSDHLCATFLLPFLGATSSLDVAMGLLGSWAVIIFFILSGYLITSSILYNIKNNGGFVWQDYLVSRIARIYPPLIASLVLCVIIFWIANHFNLHGKQAFRLPTDLYVIRDKFEFRYREIGLSLLMRGGALDMNGPLWSLYVEVKTYLLAMFVAILGYHGGKLRRIGQIVSVIGIISILPDLIHNFTYVAIWTLGGIFALVLQGNVVKRSYLKPVYGVAILIFLFCSIMAPSLFMQQHIFTGAGFTASIAFSIILAGFMFDWQIGAQIISSFSGTAKYSYTLYIVHFPLLLFAFSLTHQFLASNFHYGYLVGVCGLTFVVIIWIAQTIARYFENKQYFESLIRKTACWSLGLIANFRK
jgi:peptidoglycan/LPS O-acetylase OafA/YrhL